MLFDRQGKKEKGEDYALVLDMLIWRCFWGLRVEMPENLKKVRQR